MDFRRSLLEACPSARSLFDVFRGAQEGWPSQWSAQLLAGPGQPLHAPLRPGDLLLRRAMGEARMVHIGVIQGGDLHSAAAFGPEAETHDGGRFAPVQLLAIDGSAPTRARARRIVDVNGRVPHDQALLRIPVGAEHLTTGAATLRPGSIPPAISGTGGTTARIAMVSPSGALRDSSDALLTTAATITAQVNTYAANFTTSFSSAGHTVAFDFAPSEPSVPFTSAGYALAGTDAQRSASLHWGLFDSSTQAAIAIRGGHGSTRILDELDAYITSQIRAWATAAAWAPVTGVVPPFPLANKRIVGYSDFTAVLLANYALLGRAGLHGPMISSSGGTTSRNLLVNAFTQAPTSGQVQGGLTLHGTRPTASIRGVLLGGNLSLVEAMYGSKFFPSLQGGILFVEEVGEDGRKIDRMIEALKHRGAAAQVLAVVVGRCSNIDSAAVATLIQQSWGVPCASGLTAGHGTGGNNPIWIGLEHELEFPATGGAILHLRP